MVYYYLVFFVITYTKHLLLYARLYFCLTNFKLLYLLLVIKQMETITDIAEHAITA